MISFEGVRVFFGAQEVLRGVSGRIEGGQRIGLVGENGAGKTTLLSVLLNKADDMYGTVTRRSGIRIASTQQDVAVAPCETVLSWVAGEQGMADGHIFQRQAEQMLRELGIYDGLFQRPIDHLSGGQRTRVSLAKALIGAPDLLLLDEPTNFLDMDAMHWLAGRLKRFGGSVVIVTHDRYFLDQVADYIWELSKGHLSVYRGNYTAYRSQRDHKEQTARTRRNQMIKKRQQLKVLVTRLQERYHKAHNQASNVTNKMETPYRRARAKKHARQMKARAKQLARLDATMPAESYKSRQPLVTFTAMDIASDNLLILENVSYGYSNGCSLLRDVTASVKPGDRIGLLGNNGSGKTTLLRMIMQELVPSAGVIKRSPSLKIGYLPQDLQSIPLESSGATWLSLRLGVGIPAARRLLSHMNITKDEATKTLGQLSMGQRYRTLIAALLAQEAGLLVLDEPTNYLDLHARECVEQAIREYSGALLLVSHDRYFLEALTNMLWVIRDCTLTPFRGRISEYQEWYRIESSPERKARHRDRQRLREHGMLLELRLAHIASRLQHVSPQTDDWLLLDRVYKAVAEELYSIKVRLTEFKK